MKYALADIAWTGKTPGKARPGEQVDETLIPWRNRREWCAGAWVCSNIPCGFGDTEPHETCPECGSKMTQTVAAILVDSLPQSFIDAKKERDAALLVSAKAADAAYLAELTVKIKKQAEAAASEYATDIDKARLKRFQDLKAAAEKAAAGREAEIMGSK